MWHWTNYLALIPTNHVTGWDPYSLSFGKYSNAINQDMSTMLFYIVCLWIKYLIHAYAMSLK